MEVLELTFAKLYREISNFNYDCENILNKLHENGLVNDKRYQDVAIGNEQKTKKNRWVATGSHADTTGKVSDELPKIASYPPFSVKSQTGWPNEIAIFIIFIL